VVHLTALDAAVDREIAEREQEEKRRMFPESAAVAAAAAAAKPAAARPATESEVAAAAVVVGLGCLLHTGTRTHSPRHSPLPYQAASSSLVWLHPSLDCFRIVHRAVGGGGGNGGGDDRGGDGGGGG
jgi:uncharacterized membrane protein YgcG